MALPKRKKCPVCNTVKGNRSFYRRTRPSGIVNLSAYCRRCTKTKVAKDPKRKLQLKRAKFKQRYGVTLEEVEMLRKSQRHRCAICGIEEAQIENDVLCLDHCHTTGTIRGMLCRSCNTGLARFQDDIGVLSNAIRYLRSTQGG